jgi:predicted nucleic acid-binding protein
VLLDTTFLIDLQRGLRNARRDAAVRFLVSRPEARVCISLVSWLEFAEGYADEQEDACHQFLSRFRLVLPDLAIAWRASRLSRTLRAGGRRLADHDLWIAATAIERRVPLVTKNVRHFRVIADLEVIGY